jgi:sodium pump decarboxylase gamma subunit
MSVGELLVAGLQLTLVGMSVVFILLGLGVYAVAGMSRLAQALGDDEPSPASPPAQTVDLDQEAELISVIGAAVHRYRAGHRR